MSNKGCVQLTAQSEMQRTFTVCNKRFTDLFCKLSKTNWTPVKQIIVCPWLKPLIQLVTLVIWRIKCSFHFSFGLIEPLIRRKSLGSNVYFTITNWNIQQTTLVELNLVIIVRHGMSFLFVSIGTRLPSNDDRATRSVTLPATTMSRHRVAAVDWLQVWWQQYSSSRRPVQCWRQF